MAEGMKNKTHESHSAIIKRLKRAEGHLRSTIAMIEEGRDCMELAQQLHAVEAAIGNAKRELIHDHIDHCLESPDNKTAKGAIAEMKALTKFL
jgi:DNA-binding FrmR family transcriptional regulator